MADKKPSSSTNKPGKENENTKQLPQIPCKFDELKDKFKVEREIGRGSYGVVYKAKSIKGEHVSEDKYAVKRIFPTINANIIQSEIYFLKLLRGRSNVVQLLEGYRQGSQISLVMSYQKNVLFTEYFASLSIDLIKVYMYKMLESIAHLEDLGIMHRDIKPSNFLFNPANKSAMLIDFGLAEINPRNARVRYSEEEKRIVQNLTRIQDLLNVKNKIGTKGFLAPEIIFSHPNQSTAVDVWAAGVILLSILSKRHPFFSMNHSCKIDSFTVTSLVQLSCIFGAKKIQEAALHYGRGILFPADMKEEPMPWEKICYERDDIPDDCFDLLDKMLCLYSEKRIKARAALEHDFFADIEDCLQ